MRKALVAALVAGTLASTSATGADPMPRPREGAVHSVPLFGTVVRPYDAPENPFAPGHRGVDVGAPTGTAVMASVDGVVSFAGNVAGNLTVTVDHAGNVKTSYSFLGSIALKKGAHVLRGDVVGRV